MRKTTSDKESTLPPARRALAAVNSLLILLLALFSLSCSGGANKPSANAGPTPAASPSPQSSPARLIIDADRAFEHVRKQVEFGPRPAGSAELARARDYIVGELKSYGGLNVTLDEFTAKTPIGERKMANIIAELPGESPDIIILSSHYDTKLFKDFTFVGANDAGSSTATLLEMARVMAQSGQKPRLTYRFVFFDGEEAFCTEWEDCTTPDGPDNTYGSRHYVQLLKTNNEIKNVRAMILLDMMGYKDLRLGQDREMSMPWLIDEVWNTARELGYSKQFVNEEEGVGGDDHEPFMKAHVPSLDIIQLSTYPYWHRPEDTLDKISPQSLKTVGDVVFASLPRIEQRVLNSQPK